MARKFKIYNNGIIDKRVYEGDVPPDGFVLGSHHHHTAWNKGLTADSDDRVKQYTEKRAETISNMELVAWNKGLTKETDSRIHGTVGEANSMYGKHPIAWNKGLTKDNDERMKKASDNLVGRTPWNKGKSITGHPHTQETKNRISETHKSDEFKQKRYTIMKANNTLYVNESKAEKDYYNYLLSLYELDDIEKQYFDEKRYPFKCDFYIKSKDLFIEVNSNWTHGKHPFDINNEEDVNTLKEWQEKAKTSEYYQNAIYTWTDLDVRKQSIAKENNLNYLAIY